MGTQQILLIVLAVIIVGVSVSVGILVFEKQAYNSNRQALSLEMSNHATLVLQFWKTPSSMGGAGMVLVNLTPTACANYIGFSDAHMSTSSENGEFRLISIVGSIVTLQGMGKDKRNDEYPLATTVIDLSTGEITTTLTSSQGWQ